MKLVRNIVAAVLAVMTAIVTVEAEGATLTVDQVRQRYPWNGLVDIDYTIGDDGVAVGIDDNLEVRLVNCDVTPAVTNIAAHFLQVPLPMTVGSHRITWDANADGVTNRIDNAKFIVSITHYSAVYMVIDVSPKDPQLDYFPVDFLNGAPVDAFNSDEYKGDKIVLRRIRPGSYVAGSPDGGEASRDWHETQHGVLLSRPFYIGVFEVTQRQYLNVTGSNPSGIADERRWFRPVETVSYETIRGGNWPAVAAPGAGTFMDVLIQKCRSKGSDGNYTEPVGGFDLPTEFQWEFACRAGTSNAFDNTTAPYDNRSSSDQETQVKLLGRVGYNQADRADGTSEKNAIVGSYKPNSWGLYDMHGNVWEWCRDWYVEDPTTINPRQYVDPKGPDSGLAGRRVERGGSRGSALGTCRAASRGYDPVNYTDQSVGFRLSRSMP